jgi:nucleoside phosphorylase
VTSQDGWSSSEWYQPEPQSQALRAIAQRFVEAWPLQPAQVELLMADHGARIEQLHEAIRQGRPVILNEEGDFEPRGVDLFTDIAVLTVLPEELYATREVFDIGVNDFEMHGGGSRRFYQGSIGAQRAGRSLSLVVTDTIRSGNAEVGQAVMELETYFHPQASFLVGVAAGNKAHHPLGTVVVPEWVHYYEPERVTDSGIQARFRPAEVPDDLYKNLRYWNGRGGNYRRLVSEFLAKIEPVEKPAGMPDEYVPTVVLRNVVIGSGEKVSRSQPFMDELYGHNSNITSVDQESYGFASANRGRRWAVIRGISDHGTGSEEGTKEDWKVVASGFAAAWLRDFIEREYMLPSTNAD